MGKIINFLEAKQALEMGELKRRLQEEIEPPVKRAKIISALPGEIIPPEYEDIRPYMQRDGLIFTAWATWTDEYGIQNYKNYWVKSCGKLKNYSDCWYIDGDIKNMFAKALPDKKGDYRYREGILNSRRIVDTVFICAPVLTVNTRPYFIEKLKENGVNVDFNFDFSLGYAKEIEFKRQVERIKSLGSEKILSGEASV